MIAFSRVGDWWVLTLIAALMTFSGISGVNRFGLTMGLGALFAAVLAHVVKRASRRARPDARIEGFQAVLMNPDKYSFPSGHTAGAFGAAIAALVLMPLIGIWLVPLACAIGFSRVYLGAHYPLDVTAGAVIGSVAGVLAWATVIGLA